VFVKKLRGEQESVLAEARCTYGRATGNVTYANNALAQQSTYMSSVSSHKILPVSASRKLMKLLVCVCVSGERAGTRRVERVSMSALVGQTGVPLHDGILWPITFGIERAKRCSVRESSGWREGG
jgi:hypothetical protein